MHEYKETIAQLHAKIAHYETHCQALVEENTALVLGQCDH
jgi:regulator of replication initiation timing